MSRALLSPYHFETCGQSVIMYYSIRFRFFVGYCALDIFFNEEQNIQYSQIADKIEQDYMEETMVFLF